MFFLRTIYPVLGPHAAIAFELNIVIYADHCSKSVALFLFDLRI